MAMEMNRDLMCIGDALSHHTCRGCESGREGDGGLAHDFAQDNAVVVTVAEGKGRRKCIPARLLLLPPLKY